MNYKWEYDLDENANMTARTDENGEKTPSITDDNPYGWYNSGSCVNPEDYTIVVRDEDKVTAQSGIPLEGVE